MGNKVYTAATFGPDRYQLNNTRSMNHNVPMISEMEQHVGRSYAAHDVKADENGASLNIASAYPAEAEVESLERTFKPENGRVILKDTVKLLKPQTVTWVFMLRNEPVLKENKAHFGKLAMRFDSSLSARVEEMPVDDQRMQRSFPGSLWRLTMEAPEALKHEHIFTIERI